MVGRLPGVQRCSASMADQPGGGSHKPGPRWVCPEWRHRDTGRHRRAVANPHRRHSDRYTGAGSSAGPTAGHADARNHRRDGHPSPAATPPPTATGVPSPTRTTLAPGATATVIPPPTPISTETATVIPPPAPTSTVATTAAQTPTAVVTPSQVVILAVDLRGGGGHHSQPGRRAAEHDRAGHW